MTDSALSKRDRLVTAARQTVRRQGVERTTLADIAATAEVPLGNVYYYFKSKDALVSAVIDSYGGAYREMVAGIELLPSAPARLKALLDKLIEQRDQLTAHGCPIGSLNSELGKRGGDVQAEAGNLLKGLVDWSAGQFAAMGRPDARELGVALIAAYEGATLIAHALRDPEILQAEVQRLARWIDELDRKNS